MDTIKVTGNFDLHEVMTKYKFKKICLIEEFVHMDSVIDNCDIIEVNADTIHLYNEDADTMPDLAIIKRGEKFEMSLTESLSDKLVISIPGGFIDFNEEVSGPILMVTRVEKRLMLDARTSKY